MSMWEIEALAEQCILLLGQSDGETSSKRNAICGVYRMVERFDVSFIHFRTPEILMENQFFLHLPLEQHPQFEARKAEFEQLRAAGRSHWIQNSEAAYEAIYQPAGEKIPEGLWFDVDMPLWQLVCDAGLLKGLATEAVAPPPVSELIIQLMTLADQNGPAGFDVLKMLHGFVAYYFAGKMPRVGEAPFAAALELTQLKTALTPRSGDNAWVDERFDVRDALEYADENDQAFLNWWATPYQGIE